MNIKDYLDQISPYIWLFFLIFTMIGSSYYRAKYIECKMKIICAWCEKKVTKEDIKTKNVEGVSYSICKPCMENEFPEPGSFTMRYSCDIPAAVKLKEWEDSIMGKAADVEAVQLDFIIDEQINSQEDITKILSDTLEYVKAYNTSYTTEILGEDNAD